MAGVWIALLNLLCPVKSSGSLGHLYISLEHTMQSVRVPIEAGVIMSSRGGFL